jgi:hypothetical protein
VGSNPAGDTSLVRPKGWRQCCHGGTERCSSQPHLLSAPCDDPTGGREWQSGQSAIHEIPRQETAIARQFWLTNRPSGQPEHGNPLRAAPRGHRWTLAKRHATDCRDGVVQSILGRRPSHITLQHDNLRHLPASIVQFPTPVLVNVPMKSPPRQISIGTTCCSLVSRRRWLAPPAGKRRSGCRDLPQRRRRQ